MCEGKKTRKMLFLLAFAIFFSVSQVGSGLAYAKDYSDNTTELKQEFNSAFNAMISNPSDVGLTTRYAELAVKLGDYESAIPPLERLLMINPDLVDVRLEVGVLYFLLNSHAMAKEYLNEVKDSGKASPEQLKRADEYLARM